MTSGLVSPVFGPKSVDRILEAIEEACKGVELDAYISAFGIQFVGPATAKVIAEYFGSWEAFMQADDDCFDYTQIPSIGPETARALTGFDYSEAYYMAKNIIKVKVLTPKSYDYEDKRFIFECVVYECSFCRLFK